MIPLRLDTIKAHGIGPFEPGSLDKHIITDREFVKTLPLEDGVTILDVGSGNGRDLAWIMDRYDVLPVALDKYAPSLKMLPRGLIKVLSLDDCLPFPDKCFDIAYANSVFCELCAGDADKLLDEMKRVATKVFYTEIYPDLSIRTFHA